ncbi:hypothetical protein N2152v2_004536 [Parachlorella kessleri]
MLMGFCVLTLRSVAVQVTVQQNCSLESVKSELRDKQGVQNKCLRFKLSGLRGAEFQGILFSNDRAIGKLCSPTVCFTPLTEDAAEGAGSTAVHQCSVAFESWVPAGSGSGPSQPLRIPVDLGFEQAELSVQVVGRQSGDDAGGTSSGSNFALPHRYSVQGKELAARLGVELQRQDYIRKHQEARGTCKPPPGSGQLRSSVTLESGNEVERLLSVFDVAERPAWLRSLVCKFLVAESPSSSVEPATAQPPSAAPGPPTAPHVADSGGNQGTEGVASIAASGSSGAAVSSSQSEQAQQQKAQGRQEESSSSDWAAGEGNPARLEEGQHQHQRAGGKGGASTAHSLAATEASRAEAQGQGQSAASKRTRKRKAKPSRMPVEQSQLQHADAGGLMSDLQAEHEPPETQEVPGLAGQQEPPDSPAERSSQGRGRGQHQQHRRAQRAATQSPTAASAKQRRVHNRAAEWEETSKPPQSLPPPPGLHLQQQPEQKHEVSDQAAMGPGPGRPASDRPSGRRSRQLLAAAAQTRWARRQLGRGVHRGAVLDSHGSSSDVSSEVATSARSSSTAELSPRSSSPATEAAGPDAASPRVSVAAARGTVNGSIPGPLIRQRTLDTPAALRLLTEALLPQERPWQRTGSRGVAGAPPQLGSSSDGGLDPQEQRLGSSTAQQPSVTTPEHQLASTAPKQQEQQQLGSGALLEPSSQQLCASAVPEERPERDATCEPCAADVVPEQQVLQPASDASLQDPSEQQPIVGTCGGQALNPAQHQQKPWQESGGEEQCPSSSGADVTRQLDLPASAGWAVASDGVQSSPMSSAPSTPRSGFLAANGSLEYPSSTTSSQAPWDSPRRQYGMPYHFGAGAAHGAAVTQISPDTSSSSFQSGYQERKSLRPYSGRLPTQHHWQHGDVSLESGSASGWSHQHSRLGTPVSHHPGPIVAGRQSRMPGPPRDSGAATALSPTWQQRQQHEEGHRRSYSSPTMASMMAGGPWSGSPFASGHLGAQPANGTYPAAYQHCSQHPYAQAQSPQAGLLAKGPMHASLGHPLDARLPQQHQWQQQRQAYDPGYQQQQHWQQQKAQQAPLPQQHRPDGLANGYTRAHSRSSSYGGGDAALYSTASGSPVGQIWPPAQHQQRDRLRQWHPSSSASTSRAPSLAASPLVHKTPVHTQQQVQQQQFSAAALPPHQPGLHAGVPAGQLALQLQVADSIEDSPDLERLLQAVTPAVLPPGGDFAEMTLADVWRFYEVPSMFGQEVVTLGGPRGPAASYYLPYLSAVQLFCSGAEPGTGNSSCAPAAADVGSEGSAAQDHFPPHQQPPQQQQQQPVFSFPGGLEEWPEHMHLQYQWFAGGHVGERVPLDPHLDALCGSSSGSVLVARDSSHPLLATRIVDLHPYSWFSVAWYPIMRIPEAPLDARFLTYHSLASLWELACEARARRDSQASIAAPAIAASGAASQPAVQPCSCRPEGNPFAHAATGPVPGAAQVASSLHAGGAASSSTPTGVCSFPASPTCSDSCTRTTAGGSVLHTSAGAATAAAGRPCGVCSLHSVGSDPRSELGSAQWASTNHSTSLTSPSPSHAGSVLGEGGESLRGQSSGGLEGEVVDAEAVSVPVVGLQWYSFARSVEVWTETLVAAQLPEDVLPSPGTLLADGSRVMGCWRGVAVVAKPYPSAKGGAMAWEVRLEELAETAGRLATGAGLQCRLPDGRLVPAGVRCPDHDFFASRAWTCKSSAAAAAARWGGDSGHGGGAGSGAANLDYHHPHQHHTYRG